MKDRVIKRNVRRIIRYFRLVDKRGPSWAKHERTKSQCVDPLIWLDRHGINHTNIDKYT